MKRTPNSRNKIKTLSGRVSGGKRIRNALPICAHVRRHDLLSESEQRRRIWRNFFISLRRKTKMRNKKAYGDHPAGFFSRSMGELCEQKKNRTVRAVLLSEKFGCFFDGGGGGCRTRVRKYVPWNLSERSLFVYFPFRRHKGQGRAVGSFINSSCEAKLIRTTFPVSS